MDYTQYDYNALVEAITEKLSETEGWGEGFQSSTGQLLIQLFADTTDSLMYMLERRSQEAFLTTARLQSSIFAHASELGYRPSRVITNGGELLLELLDVNGNSINANADIIIEKNTKISSVNPPIDFVVTEEAVIEGGSNSTVVKVKEGVFSQVTVDTTQASFTENFDVLLDEYRNIDNNTLHIFADDAIYYDVDSAEGEVMAFGALAYASPTSTVYDVRYTKDGMRLVFGNDNFGKTPEGTLTIEYIESQGNIRPILTTGLDFEFETNTLNDTSGILPATEYYYSLTNTTPISGYRAPESTESIARNAPVEASSGKTAVKLNEYEYWILKSGLAGLVDVNAYGEQETGSLIFNMNNIHVTYANEALTELTPTQINDLRTYMNRRKVATTHIVFVNSENIEIVADITFKRNFQLPISDEELYKVLRRDINSYFAITEGSIGKDFQHSELVEYLQNLTYTLNNTVYPMCDWVKVAIVPQYELPDGQDVYDVRMTLDQSYPITVNDEWIVTIDGDPITVNVQSGDDHDILTERMRAAINDNTPLRTDRYQDDLGNWVIRMVALDDQTFTVDTSTGDLSAFVTTNIITYVPKSQITNTAGDDLVIPGSCTIVDSNETVIFQDDGLGTLVRQGGGNDIGIDYKDVVLFDLYKPDPLETYYFRFKQNEFQNVSISSRGVLTLSPIATFGNPELYSSLTLV